MTWFGKMKKEQRSFPGKIISRIMWIAGIDKICAYKAVSEDMYEEEDVP